MNFNYKISTSTSIADKIELQIKGEETNDFQIIDILSSFPNFLQYNSEKQNSILIDAQQIFTSNSFNLLNFPDKLWLVSDFFLNFIQNFEKKKSDNYPIKCSIYHFLRFFAEWTYSHNVNNESFTEELPVLSFLLYHSIQNPNFNIEIQIFSLIILLNIVNDSKSMRRILIDNYLNNESQIYLFVNMINMNSNNIKIPQIIFRIFNIILENEKINVTNFNAVIENIINPSISRLLFDFPNEVIRFISIYLYFLNKKNGKKIFFGNMISGIPFEKIYESIQVFDEEKNIEIFDFLRSLLDNNKWEYDYSINIKFEPIINYFYRKRRSSELQMHFCDLLISYFRHPSNLDLEDDYNSLFNFIASMTNEDFKIRECVLILYFTIFVTKNEMINFNPIISIYQNFEILLNFFFDFLECDSEDITEKALKIILSILHLLPYSDNLCDKDYMAKLFQDLIMDDRFYQRENQSINIILEQYNTIFPSKSKTQNFI